MLHSTLVHKGLNFSGKTRLVNVLTYHTELSSELKHLHSNHQIRYKNYHNSIVHLGHGMNMSHSTCSSQDPFQLQYRFELKCIILWIKINFIDGV